MLGIHIRGTITAYKHIINRINNLSY